MTLRIRYVGAVDQRLKDELRHLGQWLRSTYRFAVPLEIRFVHRDVLVDEQGECAMRWWQSTADHATVTGELAVKSFARHMREEGPSTAFPTVVAAVGRLVRYYFFIVRDVPVRQDRAEKWGDRLLAAYAHGEEPPVPWRGYRWD